MSFNRLREIITPSWSEHDQKWGDSPSVNALLTEWEASLPRSKFVVDLAAGAGYEARHIASLGRRVIAQDLNPQVWKSVYPVDYGPAYDAKCGRERLGGMLLKDTIVFLFDDERKTLFENARNKLVGGGSILIISQTVSVDTARVFDGKWAWSVVASDYGGDRGKFSANLEHEVACGNQVFSLELQTTAEQLIRGAKACGLRLNYRQDYRFSDPLGRENRWVQADGFVLDFRN